MLIEKMFSVRITGEHVDDTGIFTWDIEKNIVFADRAVARLHGLNPEETVRGLPIEIYLARVHPDDRPRLAKGITETIVAELPQQEGYRVQGSDSIYRAVVAFGRAFRNRDGDAVLYSGIIIPDPVTTTERPH
jgi:PAS domain-containing protein